MKANIGSESIPCIFCREEELLQRQHVLI